MVAEYAGAYGGMRRLAPSLSRVSASVLIVEDEALVRAMGVCLFAEAGFRPIEAANSDEALERLEADAEVQLLFTDVNLPGTIDGLALAWQARDRWPHIGIISSSFPERLCPSTSFRPAAGSTESPTIRTAWSAMHAN